MEYFWWFYINVKYYWAERDYEKLSHYYASWMAYIIRVLEANMWSQMTPDEQVQYQAELNCATEGMYLRSLDTFARQRRENGGPSFANVSREFLNCLYEIVNVRNLNLGHNYYIGDPEEFCRKEKELFEQLAEIVRKRRYAQWFFDRDCVTVARPFLRQETERLLHVRVVTRHRVALKIVMDDNGTMELNRTYLIRLRAADLEKEEYVPDLDFKPLKISPFADVFPPIGEERNMQEYLRILLSVKDNYDGQSRHGYIFRRDDPNVGSIDWWTEFRNADRQTRRRYSMRSREGRAWHNEFTANYDDWKFISTEKNEEIRRRITDYCKNAKWSRKILTILGTGGLGKTAVVQFAALNDPDKGWSMMKEFSYVIFLSAKKSYLDVYNEGRERALQPEEYFDSYEGLKKRLSQILFENQEEQAGNADCGRIQDVRDNSQQGYMLILDDFESLREREREKILDYLTEVWLPADNRVIITSRVRIQGNVLEVEVSAMDETESADFVVKAVSSLPIDPDSRQTLSRALFDSEHCRENRNCLYRLTVGLPVYCFIFARRYMTQKRTSSDIFSGIWDGDFEKIRERGYEFLYGNALESYVDEEDRILLAILGNLIRSYADSGVQEKKLYFSGIRAAYHMVGSLLGSWKLLEDDEIRNRLEEMIRDHILVSDSGLYEVPVPSMEKKLVEYARNYKHGRRLVDADQIAEIVTSISYGGIPQIHRAMIAYLDAQAGMTIEKRRQKYAQILQEVSSTDSVEKYRAVYEILSDCYTKWCRSEVGYLSPAKFEKLLDSGEFEVDDRMKASVSQRRYLLKTALIRMDCHLKSMEKKPGSEEQENRFFEERKAIFTQINYTCAKEDIREYKRMMAGLYRYKLERELKTFFCLYMTGSPDMVLISLEGIAQGLIEELNPGACMEQVLKDLRESQCEDPAFLQCMQQLKLLSQACSRIHSDAQYKEKHTKRTLGTTVELYGLVGQILGTQEEDDLSL